MSTKANRFVNKIFKRCASCWAHVPQGPPDPILGVTEAFRACKDPKKVNLGVGAYRDDNNKPYVLPCVRKADKMLFEEQLNKEYTPISGTAEFGKLTISCALGDGNEAITAGRCAVAQTISGSGALRLGFQFISTFYPQKLIHVPTPTWGNHNQIAKHAGLEVKQYKYYDAKTCALNFTGLMEDFSKLPDSSCVLFHACAHNPTGVDPSQAQWDQLADVCKKKKLLPFFDMAYQGFASGDAARDAYAIRKFVKEGVNIILAQSYAKNMGLYGERVGALTILTDSKEETTKVLSQMKIIIRGMYSSPPINGSRLVTKVLGNANLKAEWQKEFKQMADRIITARKALKDNLKKEGSSKNWDHIVNQIGMFCFTGMTPDQVGKLIKDHHIFLTKNGRISIGGLNMKNVEYVAHCMHIVTK